MTRKRRLGRTRAARFFNWFVRNPASGDVVIAQLPNLPLAIWLAATALRVVIDPQGAARTATSIIATLALAWWAADEVVRGASPFRRVLGVIVLIAIAVTRLTR